MSDEPIRLNKYLSQLGVASRREAESMIAEGRIQVNGDVVEDLGRKIIPNEDAISIDGKPISQNKPPLVYWMLHKPDMCLSSRKPEGEKSTVFDLPKLRNQSLKLNLVGRLDFRTEGLLLLSNDGELTHRLMHPKFKVSREYYALVNKKLTKEQLQMLRQGIQLEDGPVKVKIRTGEGRKLGATTGSAYQVTVFEGRNRLVRRIFEHFDVKVVRLFRYGFGDLRLEDNLRPGDYRQLTSDEINYLKESTQLTKGAK